MTTVDPRRDPLPATKALPSDVPGVRSNVAAARRRPGLRRVKRVLRHVDPISVLKLSLFYSLIFLFIWMIVVAILFWMVDGRGVFTGLEDLSDGLALGWDLNITLFWVEKWAFLIGLTVAILGSLTSMLMVVVYNVAADLFGGVEMTHVERDL